MNSEFNNLIKKTKRRRRFLIFLFILTLAVSILFLGDIEVTRMPSSQTVHYGAGLPGFAIFLIVAAECIVFFFIGAFDMARVENILLNECDPEKYFAVRTSMNRKLTTASDIAASSAKAALAGGDFVACVNYAVPLANDKKAEYRFASAVDIFKASFFLGDRQNMMIAFDKAKVEFGKISSGQKAYTVVLSQMEMLSYLSGGNLEAALRIADSLQPSDASNYVVAFDSFYKGLVYRAANETIKAIHCFMTASEKGGKMFIKAESEKYIQEYEKSQDKTS